MDLSRRDFYKNLLKDISQNNELVFFSHPILAMDYFKEVIIPQQIHIDLIITDTVFSSFFFTDLLEFFRTSKETYSYRNFKLSSIPILLHSNHFQPDDFGDLHYSGIMRKSTDENDDLLPRHAKEIVKNWRQQIFNDLEVLGIGVDYSFDKINIGYTVKTKSEQTFILSSDFILKQTKLPYLWLDKSYFEQEASIEELETLINQQLKLSRNKLERIQWENQLQDFFNRNPKFLFNNSYSRFWSEPKLYYPNSRKHIKPDFVTQPIISAELGKNWEVFDLKLPAQEFLQQTEFHKSFTSKFQKCLVQITDYKEYFKKDVHKQNIETVLKFHPKHPKLTLVVGRRNQLLEQQDKIFERLEQMNYASINLLTYDEILDYQKREFERLVENKPF